MEKERLYRENREFIDVIKELYAKYGDKKMRFLDVGCADGNYIDMHSQYFEHIEFADLKDQRSGTSLKYPFKIINLNDEIDLIDRYDFIVSLEVIEHLSNVKQGINNLKNLLSEGGYLLISTPNRLRLVERIKNFLGMPTVFPMKGDLAEKHFQEFRLEELLQLFPDDLTVVYKTYVLNRIRSFILPFSLPQEYKQNIIVLLKKKIEKIGTATVLPLATPEISEESPL